MRQVQGKLVLLRVRGIRVTEGSSYRGSTVLSLHLHSSVSFVTKLESFVNEDGNVNENVAIDLGLVHM